jgi:hypothetical protein
MNAERPTNTGSSREDDDVDTAGEVFVDSSRTKSARR